MDSLEIFRKLQTLIFAARKFMLAVVCCSLAGHNPDIEQRPANNDINKYKLP